MYRTISGIAMIRPIRSGIAITAKNIQPIIAIICIVDNLPFELVSIMSLSLLSFGNSKI
jgi:hypothetical protein